MDKEPLYLPFGSELSPAVIDLPFLLEVCKNYGGDKTAIEKNILEKYFNTSGGGVEDNKKKMAKNCRLSLQNYKLLDKEFHLTPIGEKLYQIRNYEAAMIKEFAKHILLNLNGLLFTQILKEIFAAGQTVNLATLRAALLERNLSYPPGGKHPSIMRLWLSKAGIFSGKQWMPDTDKINEILNTDNKMDSLSVLDDLQKAFLKALINIGASEPISASDVVKLASATYGVSFPEKSLPKQVLNKLEEEGFIIATKTTSGRGAKPFDVQVHPDIDPSVIIPALKQLEQTIDPKLHQLLLKPLSEIITEIKSSNTYISGLALEALAFKLMRLIDLDYMATRLRGEQTGGAEVDLVFESTRLAYSRWQIQCKNTSKVHLDPVAKEVGLTHFLKSNVIVVVTTGTFSAEAIRYSNTIMKDSNLSIILMDKNDIDKVIENPVNIVDILNRKAKQAMEIKKILII